MWRGRANAFRPAAIPSPEVHPGEQPSREAGADTGRCLPCCTKWQSPRTVCRVCEAQAPRRGEASAVRVCNYGDAGDARGPCMGRQPLGKVCCYGPGRGTQTHPAGATLPRMQDASERTRIWVLTEDYRDFRAVLVCLPQCFSHKSYSAEGKRNSIQKRPCKRYRALTACLPCFRHREPHQIPAGPGVQSCHASPERMEKLRLRERPSWLAGRGSSGGLSHKDIQVDGGAGPAWTPDPSAWGDLAGQVSGPCPVGCGEQGCTFTVSGRPTTCN